MSVRLEGGEIRCPFVFSGKNDEPTPDFPDDITPARKFRMLLHTNPTRERGECLETRAGASEDM